MIVSITGNAESSPFIAKQWAISEELRKEIIDGKLAPGGRLPTQSQLVTRFKVSPVTVQRAIDRLIREGFIRTHGRNGTFVTLHPPHLFSYGIVFRDRETKPGRSRYHEMLESQALRLQRTGDRKITIFHGITGRDDTEDSKELLQLVRSHQMAGLLLIDGDVFGGTPLLDEPEIYRAAVMSQRVENFGCPIIYPDMHGMIDLALDTLVKQGRKRVVCVITVPVYQFAGDYLLQAMHDRGMWVDYGCLQILPHDIPEASRNAVAMSMAQRSNQPDGLFVVDENLLEGACAGLVASGAKVPDEVVVVSHCHFPRSSPSVLPVQRVGFDVREVLEIAVNIIDTQRQGRDAPLNTQVAAVLEEEYPSKI